jgi:hypothetical protein
VAGLVAAIHAVRTAWIARDKPAHDEWELFNGGGLAGPIRKEAGATTLRATPAE